MCLIIHSLATKLEHGSSDAKFEQWVAEGLKDDIWAHDDEEEVKSFVWHSDWPQLGRETDGQYKQWQVKEALFAELY